MKKIFLILPIIFLCGFTSSDDYDKIDMEERIKLEKYEMIWDKFLKITWTNEEDYWDFIDFIEHFVNAQYVINKDNLSQQENSIMNLQLD